MAKQQGPKGKAFDLSALESMNLEQLYEVARDIGITGYTKLRKSELIFAIIQTQTEKKGLMFREGLLDVLQGDQPGEKYGLLRVRGFVPSDEDVWVADTQIRKFKLKNGDLVSGQVRAPKDSERFFALLRIEAINGDDPEVARTRPAFEDLTPVYPNQRLKLETGPSKISPRLIDLVAPIGLGQRGMIVAPPKAGKTTLLKTIANSITENYPDAHMMVLLIDERPEEVTDIRRSVRAEVIASTFDELPENHLRVADLVLNRAQRLVEQGKDVVVLLDSITRLSRASNITVNPSGRTLSGGLDPSAMYRPKRFFGAARNIEEGGSLTVLATALVDTGSRMDDMIFEEFKGTGNWELVLDRSLAEKRIFPAIDIRLSGTRHEELLLSPDELKAVWALRRAISHASAEEAIKRVLDMLRQSKNNVDFLDGILSSLRKRGVDVETEN